MALPDGFIKVLNFAASWCAGFDYTGLARFIANLLTSNAFEESPTQYKLLRSPPQDSGA
jgi:hypothetical protein